MPTQQDTERKHAEDRETWRREMAAAVRAAREEMAAATEQLLDATTRSTILDNEAMTGGCDARVLGRRGRWRGLLLEAPGGAAVWPLPWQEARLDPWAVGIRCW